MTAKESNKASDKPDDSLADQVVTNFRTFFNTIDHMLGVVDLDGFFIEVNDAGLERLGYVLKELKGKDANVIFPVEVHDEITQRFYKIKETGKDSWTYSLLTKRGGLIPAEITFHKGVWDNQEAYFILAKEVGSEEMLSKAREVSLRILNKESNGRPDSVIKMALKETIKLTNSKIGFFGTYLEGESILSDLIWVISDKSLANESYPDKMFFSPKDDLVNRIKPDKPLLIEDLSRKGELSISPYLHSGLVVPIIDRGEVKYLVGLGNKQDIYNELDKNIISILWDNVASKIKRVYFKLELEESEAEYKNLFNSSRDALLLFDLNAGKIVLCNDETLRMFGYRSHTEILKKSPLELSAEFQPDGSRSSDALRVNPSQALLDRVYIPNWIHVKKNGKEFPSEVTLTSVTYKGRQIILANIRDISDKLKVASELEMSEQSINLAIKEAELGIWDYNCSTGKMIIGKGFGKFYGANSEKKSISIDKWLDLIHPDDFEKSKKLFNDHVNGKSKAYRCEYRIQQNDGVYKWVLVSGRAISRDDKGKAERVVGILMDIDSSRILSKQAEDTRNFLQMIISSIESILFVKDDSGRYLLINRAFTEKLGLKEKEVLGKTSNELPVRLNLDTLLTDEIVIKQGIEQTYEEELRLNDGKVYDFLVTKIPVKDKEGRVYAQVGLATDITHIKKLERDLRNNFFSLDAAINGTGNGLWEWNPKDDDLILNDNWFQMLGYTRSYFNKRYKKFSFKTFADFIHPEDIEDVGKELEKHYAGETDYYRTEIRMLTSENQWKWILASGKVWERDKDNNPVRMVGIHVDIDYRVRIEEQLKQALLKAEESDRLKSAFLANMSHEIRTPMNGIIGFLDLLESDNISVQHRNEYMNIIRSNSVQLLNIVNDIVDISKIESGLITVHKTWFDLLPLLDEIEMQYKPGIEQKHLYLKTDCRLEERDREINTDHTKLRQVLSNLISNAIKFTNKGGILLRCERIDRFIEFCVADTGMGIAVDIQNKVFDRFVQADPGLSRIQEGTGLGLSICKAYVEKLGGKIWVESSPGKGSKFFFTIPVDASEDPLLDSPEKEIFTDDLQERLVLVVEDEIYNFLFVEQVLQNKGIKVVHAENGLKAIDLIKDNTNIAMVFMDIRMPGIDGYETTRRIKRIKPDLPVVALTALALSGDREKAIESGCDDYLKKPILRDELLAIIDKVFDK